MKLNMFWECCRFSLNWFYFNFASEIFPKYVSIWSFELTSYCILTPALYFLIINQDLISNLWMWNCHDTRVFWRFLYYLLIALGRILFQFNRCRLSSGSYELVESTSIANQSAVCRNVWWQKEMCAIIDTQLCSFIFNFEYFWKVCNSIEITTQKQKYIETQTEQE